MRGSLIATLILLLLAHAVWCEATPTFGNTAPADAVLVSKEGTVPVDTMNAADAAERDVITIVVGGLFFSCFVPGAFVVPYATTLTAAAGLRWWW